MENQLFMCKLTGYILQLCSVSVQIACAMVACTFLSAPLMFASAEMVIASNLDPKQYFKTLSLFEFDISIIASLAAVSNLKISINYECVFDLTPDNQSRVQLVLSSY